MAYTIDLSGRTAVVTGGSGALGSALCRALAEAGAAVAVLGTKPEKTQAIAQAIMDTGGTAVGIAANVLDAAAVESALQQVLAFSGRVDILINAAGGNQPRATANQDRTFFDLPHDALEDVFNLNFMGTLLPCQIFGGQMAHQRGGTIINISSMAAQRPLTRVVAYGAAKSAVDNFTRWLAVYMAREYSPEIRVNAIAPGFFLTEQNRFLLTDQATGDLTARGRQILDHTPMGRFGNPDDLIGATLWLVSDAARFVTGIVVPVDGGFSAYGGV